MLKFCLSNYKDIALINNNPDFQLKYKISAKDINKLKFVFVIKKIPENIIIGFIETNIFADECEIFHIEILKKFRGQKFSIFLIQNFFCFLDKNFFKIKKIFLEVRESNIIAINLYKKFDFEVIDYRKNYYSKPLENAIIMRLDINKDY
ncbi:MAG: GNAT family N-acetyltransferase [Elusimicrobiota bacterium]|jgi:ribosomal-protein-alanine N-acetyltransferase|nr:GNAT family N-acetyltransferase [Elusimicrobiota bacterium]